MDMIHLIGASTLFVFGLVLSFMHAETLKKLAYDLTRH
jgi:hypothetical protein